MARRYRPRKLFKFWLYQDLAEDTRLMEYIDYLRKTRQFATMVRNGLRLMWTLGQGDLSVLFDLFPTLRAQFTPDNSALIEEFRLMLQTQSAAAVPALPPGLKPIAMNKPIAMPIFDDEDEQNTIIIRRDENAGDLAADRFLQSIAALQ